MTDNSIITHQAVNFAWITFKKHYVLLTAILLTIFGAWVALETIIITGQRLGILWWTAAHLAFFFLFAGIEVGFLQACCALYDGNQPTFADTFGYLPLGPKFLVGQTLLFLMTIVGLAFLIIPGVYFVVRYAFIGFCQIEGERSLSQSFQQSARLSMGNYVYLLTVIGSLVILNAIGASFLGLGLLLTVPLSTLTMTAIYRQLSELKALPFHNSA